MVTEGKPDAPVGTTLAMIEQAQKVLNSVHKRLHNAQSQEFALVAREFKEHPESFWQRNRRPAYQWDEDQFLKALEDCDLVPQADPNTSSQTQRLMKVLALKQLVATNPSLYDPIAVDTAALQALGWSNPQQFMIPQKAQANPPPELIKAMADMQNDKISAEARMMDSQTRAQETVAKIQLDQERLAMERDSQLGGQADPAKMMELQIREQEIQQRQQDAFLDAVNRKRDRESRERLAAMRMAEELAQNPQGLGIVNQIIDPQMLQRLESNEPTLDGKQTGEL
jgi:hypothetical protein